MNELKSLSPVNPVAVISDRKHSIEVLNQVDGKWNEEEVTKQTSEHL